eukprot:1027744_1
MTRPDRYVCLLNSLTLLVCKRGKMWWTHAIAYATVNIDPVPLVSVDTKLAIEGDTKKLVLDFSQHRKFQYIPKEFTLYMVKGWPDIGAKKSVKVFRESIAAKKIELKMSRQNYDYNFQTDITGPGLKFVPIADGDKITFVFEDEERSI